MDKKRKDQSRRLRKRSRLPFFISGHVVVKYVYSKSGFYKLQIALLVSALLLLKPLPKSNLELTEEKRSGDA